jgi:predicted nucleotidyltransferase
VGRSPREALDRLRAATTTGELDDLCARHRVRIMSVFGSAAAGADNPRDLDVAVGFEPGAKADVLGLLEDLVALTGTEAVDLLVLDRAGPVAKERALVGAVPLYESEQSAYAYAQMAAMCERMETDWLRRLDLEAMARDAS